MDKKKKQLPTIRSSAAEYLSFVAANGEGGVEAAYADENVWLTQKMMATLYDVDVKTVNYHLKKIFSGSELEENSVIRNFRITATDGKNYRTKRYHLDAILAVGYRVRSPRGSEFRRWASTGRGRLDNAGKVSHSAAVKKAKLEHKKYTAKTLDNVEKDYLKTISTLEKQAKKESRKK